MKNYLLLYIALLLLTTSTLAQDHEAWTKEIRKEYTLIKKNLKSYTTKEIDKNDESTEGGHLKGYYEGTEIKLIELSWFNEMGKNSVEYYFNNEELIFVFEQNFQYNRPIYWTSAKAKEMGDTEAFDPKKTIVQEKQYYFHKEKLFRLLNPSKEEEDVNAGKNILLDKVLVAGSKKYKKELATSN